MYNGGERLQRCAFKNTDMRLRWWRLFSTALSLMDVIKKGRVMQKNSLQCRTVAQVHLK